MYIHVYPSTMYITCIHIHLQCTLHVYISIYNVHYMYTYPSTMYVYISIYNVHYMYTYPSTMYLTCIHIHLQCTLHVYIHVYTNCFSDSSAIRTAVKFYSLSLTSSSLLSFSFSSVTKPGNIRTHT